MVGESSQKGNIKPLFHPHIIISWVVRVLKRKSQTFSSPSYNNILGGWEFSKGESQTSCTPIMISWLEDFGKENVLPQESGTLVTLINFIDDLEDLYDLY